MKLRALTVSELNDYLSRHISFDPILSSLKVVGEISDYRLSSLGHAYFKIADEFSSVSCVMFKSELENWIKSGDNVDLIKNGEFVELYGSLVVYKARGQYQIKTYDIQMKGEGQSKVAFEQLKKQLDKEGLFSLEYKKALPKYPKKIAIVTSKHGAALQDVLNVLKRRASYLEVLVFSSVVQGEYAVSTIINNLNIASKYKDIDALILTRGGGAGEDLSAFNNEMLVRTVFSMPFPVISAVGHEIDTTLCDYVADIRVPTPSVAAEIVAPDIKHLTKALNDVYMDINRLLKIKFNNEYQKLDYFCPQNLRQILNLNKKNMILDSIGSKLNALSPLSILDRGYAIVENKMGDMVAFEDIQVDEHINIIFSTGKVQCNVIQKVDEGI